MKKLIRVCGDYCKGKYIKMSDQTHISDIDILKEVAQSWIGKSEVFEYQDWFGSCTLVKCSITKVLIVKRCGCPMVIMEITCNKTIPDRYLPTPYQILKKQTDDNPEFISPLGYTDVDDYMLPEHKGNEVLLELNM